MKASFLVAMALVALIGLAGESRAQTSYPLVCHGGGDMNASVYASGAISMNFTPGATAAAAAPGQCTWIDRGFRPGEPGVLSLTGDAAGVRYLVDGMLGNGNFFAHVYNNGAGAMVVTRIGP